MNTKYTLPLEPLAGEMLKSAPGKYPFSLLGFILLPAMTQGSGCLPQPLPWGMAPGPRADPRRRWSPLPKDGVLGIPKGCRLGREMLCGGEHICVGNPCLCLGFAALLPKKKELRNRLVQRSQAGKLQNELIN